MTEYNLHFRNVIITHVDWENKFLFYKFENQPIESRICFFDTMNLPHHTDDIQCLKMIMDRCVVRLFFGNIVNRCILDYIKDIFKHPYEWNTVLFEEEV